MSTWSIINGWLRNQLNRSFDLSDDPANGDVLIWDETEGKFNPGPISGASSPGSNTQVIFNDSGALAGEAEFTFIKGGTPTLTVGPAAGVVVTNHISLFGIDPVSITTPDASSPVDLIMDGGDATGANSGSTVNISAGGSTSGEAGHVSVRGGDGLLAGGEGAFSSGATTTGATVSGITFAPPYDLDGAGGSTNASSGNFNLDAGAAFGTNVAGADSNITGAQSTGNALGGAIILNASTPGASGTSVNAAAEVARFDYQQLTLGGTAGVRLSAANGTLTLLGLGDGADENLTLDFNTTANTVLVGTGTSVTKLDFGTLILEGKFNSSDGTTGATAGPFTTITSITVKDGIVTALTGS